MQRLSLIKCSLNRTDKSQQQQQTPPQQQHQRIQHVTVYSQILRQLIFVVVVDEEKKISLVLIALLVHIPKPTSPRSNSAACPYFDVDADCSDSRHSHLHAYPDHIDHHRYVDHPEHHSNIIWVHRRSINSNNHRPDIVHHAVPSSYRHRHDPDPFVHTKFQDLCIRFDQYVAQ